MSDGMSKQRDMENRDDQQHKNDEQAEKGLTTGAKKQRNPDKFDPSRFLPGGSSKTPGLGK